MIWKRFQKKKKTVSSKIGSFVSGSTVGKIGSVLADTMFPGSGRLISFFARKIAERNKVQYHSLYEPKGGWKTVVKDWCRRHPDRRSGTKYGRKSQNNWRCQNPRKSKGRWGKGTYGLCQKGFGFYDYDSIEKYGCATRHRSSKNICRHSAGSVCAKLRNERKQKYMAKKPSKRFSYKGSKIESYDPEITDGIPVIESISCDDSKTNFKIDSGGS